MFIPGGLRQQRRLVGHLMTGIAQHAHGRSPGPVIFRLQYLLQQFLVYFIQAPAYP
jgi:hypothetical protein